MEHETNDVEGKPRIENNGKEGGKKEKEREREKQESQNAGAVFPIATLDV